MTRTKAVRRLFTTRHRGWLTATSSFILSSSWPRCTSWWPSLTGSVTSQQCWRPLSPTAAGLPSGWRCRPAGPVWSSTSGSCWALCAAVRMNPDLAARASNAAQHRPAMSPSVSDTQEVAWQEESGQEVRCRRASSCCPAGGNFQAWRSLGWGVKDSRCCERNPRVVPLLTCEELGTGLMSQAWYPKPLTRT